MIRTDSFEFTGCRPGREIPGALGAAARIYVDKNLHYTHAARALYLYSVSIRGCDSLVAKEEADLLVEEFVQRDRRWTGRVRDVGGRRKKTTILPRHLCQSLSSVSPKAQANRSIGLGEFSGACLQHLVGPFHSWV